MEGFEVFGCGGEGGGVGCTDPAGEVDEDATADYAFAFDVLDSEDVGLGGGFG